MDRVVFVTKPTRFEELMRIHKTEVAAAFALETSGESIEPYMIEHQRTCEALATVHRQVSTDLAVATVERSDLPHFLFRDTDVVVVCGPDGLVVNVAQYVRQQLVIGINPDPLTNPGQLVTFRSDALRSVLQAIEKGNQRYRQLTMVQATVGDKRVYGLNEIFLGRNDQISARYTIKYGGRAEKQSSSGVIVSTGTGASAWISSIRCMVEALAPQGHNRPHALSSLPEPESPGLHFVVREAWPSIGTKTTVLHGSVDNQRELTLVCEMPQGGVVFSDGMVERGVGWRAGTTATITVADRSLNHVCG